MKKFSDALGEMVFVLLIGILFLGFGSIIYLAIVFLSGFIFGPELLRNSGIIGYLIVGVLTLLIVGITFYSENNFDKLRKHKNQIVILLGLILISYTGWYYFNNKIPSFSEGIAVDQNGNNFRFVTIDQQTWMAENLNVLTYRNGDTIYHAKTSKEWANANENKKPAWCYYEHDTIHHKRQGKLYNWYAVIDPRGIAPTGWRIPFQKDWIKLSESLGGDENSGILLKDIIWNTSEYNEFLAVDPVKMSLLPCGSINVDGYFYGMKEGFNASTKEKYNCGAFSGWWHINENNTDYANIIYLTNGTENLFFNVVNEGEGFYVRCIKDSF